MTNANVNKGYSLSLRNVKTVKNKTIQWDREPRRDLDMGKV
jgi:hypothetical protein